MTPASDPVDVVDVVDVITDRLWHARRGGPPADDRALAHPLTSLDQAYAVQDRLLAACGEPPGSPRFWKSGGPSRSGRMRHAPLPTAGVRDADSSLGDMHLRHRWIEAEIALRIRREVSPDEARQLTLADARELVDALCVSIEVLDARWASARDAAPWLKVADLLLHGALVLGPFVPFAPFASRRWDEQACRVRIGTADVQIFHGSLGVGDPAWVLPEWLRHATRHGLPVPQGSVVSSGSWCGMLDAAAGDRVVAEFPGIGESSVQL